MICCGRECDSNFCPECGTQLREAPGPLLLAHLRYQAKRLASRKDIKNRDMATKYERWAAWVQEQIPKKRSEADP